MIHQSIVRSNNHFVKLPEGFHGLYTNRWFLIDGPWFHYLEGIYKGQGLTEITLRPYQQMSRIPLDEGCIPETTERGDFLLWERKKVPYYLSSKRVFPYDFAATGTYVGLAEKYQQVHFDVIDCVLTRFSLFVGWQCNQGILPAYIKNEKWDEDLEELFTFIIPYHISPKRRQIL